MMEMYNFPHVSTKPEPSVSTSFLQKDDHQPQGDHLLPLGLPETRKRYSYTHLAAVVTSLVCLALGIVTINPSIGLAWRLRFSGQIIVIGFLLGIMNICLQTVLPFTFLLLEARFGRSRLQNYDAIVTSRFVGSHVSIPWRITFCTLLMLPLGLSVAYKRFLGGTASAVFSPTSPGHYGIEEPVTWTESSGNGFLLSSISAVTAFRDTVFGKAPYPQLDEFPIAYGYNTLLLSDGSAALLDMPSVLYLRYLRTQISAEETVDITASVDAYLARYDAQSALLQSNDELWSNITTKATLNTIYTHSDYSSRLGYMYFNNNSKMLFAQYDNSTKKYGTVELFVEPNEKEEFNKFRNRAQMFGINRAHCRAHWTVNTTSLNLVDGTCGADLADQGVLHRPDITPWYVEALPMILRMHTNTTTPEKESVWLRATYAVNIATMFWARALVMLGGSDTTYVPQDEILVISRHILRAEGSLYFVLLVQPALTVLGFVITIWLHKTPIGRNFGIVALLAGLDASNLATFQGAGLSGKLRKPVELEITIRQTRSNDAASGRHSQGEKIQYLVKPDSKQSVHERDKDQKNGSILKKGCKYQ